MIFQLEATGVAIDSRNVKKGDVFIALVGDNNNGHNYIAKAFANGAVACIAEEKIKGFDDKTVLVNDSLDALNQMAIFVRQRYQGQVIAITGSVGKTSTREMLKLALTYHGDTYAASANYNNHYGVPLTLVNMPLDIEYAIFELGMSAVGEISYLSKMVRPHIAIITTVSPAHLEHFLSVSAIAETKAEIFDGLEQGGCAVLNIDNPYFSIMHNKALDKQAKIITFGESIKADSRLLSYEAQEETSLINVSLYQKQYYYELGSLGRHLACNSLIVIAVLKQLQLEVDFTLKQLKSFTSIKGRGQKIQLANKVTIIDEAYNASPASVKAALIMLGDYKSEGRKIVVLGDMLELGDSSKDWHIGLVDSISNLDLVHTVGNNMSSLHEVLPESTKGHHCIDVNEMTEFLKNNLKPQDIVLIKGSYGMKMFTIIEQII